MFRVSTKFMFHQGLNGMLSQQAKLGATQQQISLGRKIVTPSDDPSGTAQALSFRREISTTEQYQTNLVRLRNRLELEESVLGGISDMIPRAIELVVQGGNDTYSAQQRASMAIEVRGLIDSMLDAANARDSNGEYLFSGYQGQTQPFTVVGGVYTYNGDEGDRELRVSAERTVADSNNGFEVFMDVPASGGGSRNAFETLDQIAQALEADTSPANFIDDLNLMLSHFMQVRASEGSRLASLDSQEQVNEDYILTMETSRSRIEDLDYAEALTRFNQEQISLEAAQKSFVQLQDLSLFDFIR